MASATAILLSWRRKANMPQIITALYEQSVDVEVWLINNGGYEDFGADRVVCIPWNAGEWARYCFTRRVETDWVMIQDDDLMLGDSLFVEDAMRIHGERCPEHHLGADGRGVSMTAPHYAEEITSGYAPILKGRFQLFKRESLRGLHVPWHPSASDIWFSLDVSRGRPVHWVDVGLKGRLVELEQYGVGYEFRPEHWQERDEAVRAYIEEYGLDLDNGMR